jgi:L-alanine-DL-glutamate epimerase-like enolase superfamily enzyme
MEFSAERIQVHTTHPFRIARAGGSVSGRDVDRVIVRVQHEGVIGMGEAAPAPYYGETLESVERVVEAIATDPAIVGDDLFALAEISERLMRRFERNAAAVAGVDAALHDWVGRWIGTPVYRLLGLSMANVPATSMTIGLDEPDVMADRASEAARFAALKIKVGTDRDEEILSAVRGAAPLATLRLDANAGWSADEALSRIEALARFEPELIEQPIAAGQRDALRRIHESSPTPIYADEDAVSAADVFRLRGCVTGVNVKLAKCGGIRQALKMIHVARAAGLKIMLGCMAETSLGVAAAVSLAGLADVVDLDGHLLLCDEPFGALRLEGDRVLCRDLPGLGLAP